jgi:hypothetical protein
MTPSMKKSTAVDVASPSGVLQAAGDPLPQRPQHGDHL